MEYSPRRNFRVGYRNAWVLHNWRWLTGFSPHFS
jgi:hypothetical protein